MQTDFLNVLAGVTLFVCTHRCNYETYLSKYYDSMLNKYGEQLLDFFLFSFNFDIMVNFMFLNRIE